MITAKQFNDTSLCASIMEKKHSAMLLWEDRGKKELAFHITKEELSKTTIKQASLPKSNLPVGWS